MTISTYDELVQTLNNVKRIVRSVPNPYDRKSMLIEVRKTLTFEETEALIEAMNIPEHIKQEFYQCYFRY